MISDSFEARAKDESSYSIPQGPMPSLGSITEPTPRHLRKAQGKPEDSEPESESDEDEMDFFAILRTDPIPLARVLREKTSQEAPYPSRPPGSMPPPPKTFTAEELDKFTLKFADGATSSGTPDKGRPLGDGKEEEEEKEKEEGRESGKNGFWGSHGKRSGGEDQRTRRASHISLRSAKAFLLGHTVGEKGRRASRASKCTV